MTTRSVSEYCSVSGCTSRIFVRKSMLCKQHYYLRKNGKPLDHFIRHGMGDTEEARFWSRVAITANPEKCWVWQGPRNLKRMGYGKVSYQGTERPAHVVAYAINKGRLPNADILHSCDNPPCCNPKHLREGTKADNSADKVSRERQARGQMLPNSKLDPQKVRQIRSLREQGVSCPDVAKQFGISKSVVSAVAIRKTWRWVK